MTTLENIIIFLQIATQVVAAFYILKIMFLKTTPTSPYLQLFIAITLRTILLVDNVQPFMGPHIKDIIRVLISVFTMTAFISIYYLIKKQMKHE